MTTTATSYIVVPAPGHYGDRARVLSAHHTAAAALRAAGPGLCVRESRLTKGAEWLRAYEQTSALVTR